MSIKIRPDYINPLTMTAGQKGIQKLGQPAAKQTDKVSELQTKQQQLQNQVLLLKASGTDNAGAAADTQKVLEAELEKVSAELRTAKADTSQDLYEPEKAQTASPGIYQVEKDKEQGYKISFLPYSEA